MAESGVQSVDNVQQGSRQLSRHEAAYQACLAEMQSLPKGRIQEVNLDVMAAVRTAMAAKTRLSELRSVVASSLNDFDLTHWDKLQTYTMALRQAHTAWAIAMKSPAVPRPLVETAKHHFEVLFSVVTVLVSRGLVDASILKNAKKRRGRFRYAFGLLVLVEALRQAWPQVADRTGLTEAELLAAELAGERLVTGISRKNEPVRQGLHLAEMRDRAFTLFVNAYGQVRRAVQYVRWEKNDADAFAPSLYRRRHPRKAKARAKLDAQSAQAPQPADPVPDQPQESQIEPCESATASNVPGLQSSDMQRTLTEAPTPAYRPHRAEAIQRASA
jgi:hypothetical protein